MLPRTFAVLAALLTPSLALADGTAPEGAPPPADTTPKPPVSPRSGVHWGVTAGGAAIPGTNLSVAVAELNMNVGIGKHDLRISPIVYVATGEGTSMGAGLHLERRVNLGSTYTLSAGSLVSVHSISGQGTTFAVGATASPVTLRLGANKSFELGLNIFLVREFSFDTVTPGAYVSLTRLFL